MLAEYEYYKQHFLTDKQIVSVYFGGGTPSLLSTDAVSELLNRFSRDFHSSDIEISLEANPGEISAEKLISFKSVGINRISFGSQSFTDSVLKTLGRKHQSSDIYEAVENCRAAGIENINLDLIFAVPGQTKENLSYDLECILEISPSHVSCYELTFEKGTPFYQSLARGVLKKTEDQISADFYCLICEKLGNAGIKQYEISNFARAGFESRHNSRYWERKSYLGLGAGAHSFFDDGYGMRFANLALVADYLNAITQNSKAQSWKESLQMENAMTEFIMLGLRQIKGIHLNDFLMQFGQLERDKLALRLKKLSDNGYIEINGEVAKLTSSGLLLADKIFVELA